MAMGKIEVVCGGMFSGKTEELLRRLRRAAIAHGAAGVQVFKPALDTRGGGRRLKSHARVGMKARPVRRSAEILAATRPETRVVAIDEAQFLDRGVARVAETLAARGVRVILAGLDLDYRCRPFGAMATLMALADDVTKLQAVCSRCGEPATRSRRLGPRPGARASAKRVLIGGGKLYEARCRSCWPIPEPSPGKRAASAR
jgi:thymidine kinase